MEQNIKRDDRREPSKPSHETQERGSDREDEGRAGGISNRELDEELSRQERLPDRGSSRDDQNA